MAPAPRAIIVVDLAYGDCGKGTLVDFLTRHCAAHTIVRFNGGPQAGHNVITPDGRHHTFSQIGSGAFVPGVRTLLSRFMLIEPYAMLNEAAHLEQIGVRGPLDHVMIDRRCIVITPAHQAANRLREIARGEKAHGTCGMGLGEAMHDSIEYPDLTLRAAELGNGQTVRRKLQAVCDLKQSQLRSAAAAYQNDPRARTSIQTLENPAWIEAAIENYAHLSQRVTLIDDADAAAVSRAAGTIVFEGAQGVLLDETFGFHPHTTWSTTTFANAQTLLDEVLYQGERVRLGVLRSYFTRHGAGPLVTEQNHPDLHRAEKHNSEECWAGDFRIGAFDAVAARYALAAASGADLLAITHMDQLGKLPQSICTAYTGSDDGDLFAHHLGQITDIKLHRPPSLSHQEKLAQALLQCKPRYTNIAAPGIHPFIETIQRELHVPVGIISTGPRAQDKRIIQSIENLEIAPPSGLIPPIRA